MLRPPSHPYHNEQSIKQVNNHNKNIMGCTSSAIADGTNTFDESSTFCEENNNEDDDSNKNSKQIPEVPIFTLIETKNNSNKSTCTIQSIDTNDSSTSTNTSKTTIDSTSSKYPMLYTRLTDESIQNGDGVRSAVYFSSSCGNTNISERQQYDGKPIRNTEMEELVRSVMLLEETNDFPLQCYLSSRSFSVPNTRWDGDEI